MIIPNLDLKAHHEKLRDELNEAFQRVLSNSSFVLGPEVKAFEQDFSRYCGVSHAIGTGSGTAALHVLLMAHGLGPGDEVIVPAMTFYATAEVIALTGAKPVFVDIIPETMAINHEQIEEVITPKTKGILPVHMLGLPAEMDAINEIAQKNNLWVVEDCAHAPGAKYKGQKTGSLGSGGAFSFYPGKNIGALGEAGIITTDNDELANLCRSYRDHGSTAKFEHNHIGINGRLDGIQAAMLRVKLPHLDGWNRARQKVARAYNERLANTPIILPLDFKNSEHVYHVYAIRVENRDEVFKRMQEKGIGVNIHYPVPMHLHPGFSNLGYQRGDFINAEICADETLSLPCFPEMTVNQIDYVSESLKTILSDLLQEIRE